VTLVACIASFLLGSTIFTLPIFVMYKKAKRGVLIVCNEAINGKGKVSIWTVNEAMEMIGQVRKDRASGVGYK